MHAKLQSLLDEWKIKRPKTHSNRTHDAQPSLINTGTPRPARNPEVPQAAASNTNAAVSDPNANTAAPPVFNRFAQDDDEPDTDDANIGSLAGASAPPPVAVRQSHFHAICFLAFFCDFFFCFS